MEVVPDDSPLIEDRLHHYVDDDFAFVFTTGGTGLTPDDVTPEATRAVIEREAPASPRRCAREALRHTPMGILARGVAGIAAPHADRQLPGQPEGDRRAVPGARADAAPRRRDAGAAMVAAPPAAIELDGLDAPLRRARRARRTSR